jgi:hypothetical protein
VKLNEWIVPLEFKINNIRSVENGIMVGVTIRLGDMYYSHTFLIETDELEK